MLCKTPLEYLNADEEMECVLCHKKQYSKTKCVSGHFVCDKCHTRGIDNVIAICLSSKSDNPVKVLEEMMSLPSCHMNGPEHHTMEGSALLTAYKNAGGEIDLLPALDEMQKRGKQGTIPCGTERNGFRSYARRYQRPYRKNRHGNNRTAKRNNG